MRYFTRLILTILPFVVLPLLTGMGLVVWHVHREVGQLIRRNAALELDHFVVQAEQEFRILDRLGIEQVEFYRRNAQEQVVSYANTKEIPGAFLYVTNTDGTVLTRTRDVETIGWQTFRRFEAWDWTLGIAVTRSYLWLITGQNIAFVVIIEIVIIVPLVVALYVLTRRAVRPIEELEKTAVRLAGGELDARAVVSTKDEVGRLAGTFNRMADNLQQLTHDLETRVRRRTQELERSMEELRNAQDLLVKRERMASLGGLVAGVAHEVSTPLGIAITSTTHLDSEASQILAEMEGERLSKSRLTTYLHKVRKSSELVYRSLSQADDLLKSFKQLAVDQTSEQQRDFAFPDYLQDIVDGLYPQLKRANVTVTIDCPEVLRLHSYPGMFYQIFTNLILNSINHGFPGRTAGRIRVGLRRDGNHLTIGYRDDGIGMGEEDAARVYEPFFTTKSTSENTGLGMNIVFNIVNQHFGGTIDLTTEPGAGVHFLIRLPIWA